MTRGGFELPFCTGLSSSFVCRSQFLEPQGPWPSLEPHWSPQARLTLWHCLAHAAPGTRLLLKDVLTDVTFCSHALRQHHSAVWMERGGLVAGASARASPLPSAALGTVLSVSTQ